MFVFVLRYVLSPDGRAIPKTLQGEDTGNSANRQVVDVSGQNETQR